MSEIAIDVFTGDEHAARLWEISENLHRAELTALERDEHLAEWIRLIDAKLAQPAPVSPPKGGRGREGGIRAASRELGVKRDDAGRALKVDSLAPEAKDVARAVGLDNNRSALGAAAAEPEAEAQIRYLRDRAAQRDTNKAQRRTARLNLSVDAGHFAQWLHARAEPREVPQLVAWLKDAKPGDVAAALKELAAQPAVQTGVKVETLGLVGLNGSDVAAAGDDGSGKTVTDVIKTLESVAAAVAASEAEAPDIDLAAVGETDLIQVIGSEATEPDAAAPTEDNDSPRAVAMPDAPRRASNWLACHGRPTPGTWCLMCPRPGNWWSDGERWRCGQCFDQNSNSRKGTITRDFVAPIYPVDGKGLGDSPDGVQIVP